MGRRLRLPASHRYRAGVGCLAGALLCGGASIARAAPSDDCGTASSVTTVPFSDRGDTRTATAAPGDPPQSLCSLGVTGHSVWYEFRARRAGSYVFNTHGSDYTTAISVYSGSCGAPVELACDRGLAGTVQGALRIDLTRGQVVLVEVTDALGGGGGDMSLNIDRVLSLEAGIVSGTPSPLGGAFSKVVHPHLPPSERGDVMLFEGSTEGMFVTDVLGVLRTIAVTGDPAPATGGGAFRSFGPPDINDEGVVVFRATADGGSASEGIFRWRNGMLDAVVTAGQPSPLGPPYDTLQERPDVNNGGAIAFAASVGDPASGAQEGVFLAGTGPTTTIVAPTATNPCTGGALADFTRRAVALNDAGVVAFGNGRGVFWTTTAGGAPTAAACRTDPAPGAAPGAAFGGFGDHPALHNSAAVSIAFQTRLVGPVIEALYLYSPTLCATPPLCPLALEGGAAPGSLGPFTRFFDDLVADFSTSGLVTFPAASRPSVVSVFSVFRADPRLGTLAVEATEGSPCELAATAGQLIRPERSLSVQEGTDVVVYGAQCNLGRGVERETLAGSPAGVASQSDATSAGTGFEMHDPAIAKSARVAMRGERRSVFRADCRVRPCSAITPVATPLDSALGLAGAIDDVLLGTVDGDGGVTSLVSRVARPGAPRGDAILIEAGGTLTAVARDGDPVPTLPGATFLQFATPLSSPSAQVRPILRGSRMAFLAQYVRPAMSPELGVFHLDLPTLAVSAVALEGQPAPAGLGAFLNFSTPAADDRDTVFTSLSTLAWCTYRFRAARGALTPVLCTGDPVDPPIGGTISGFTGVAAIDRAPRLIQRVTIIGGSVGECYVRIDNRSAKPLACLGDPMPAGGTLGSFFIFAELFRNPYSLKSLAYFAEIDHIGNAQYRALNVGTTRGSAFVQQRVAGEREPMPLGGRFGTFDDATPLGMAITRRVLAFNTDVQRGPVGQGILLGTLTGR